MKRSMLAFFLLPIIIFASIPPGYYDTATGTGEALKTQLYNIIKGHTSKSYDYLWTAFQTTDKKSNGKVWDMYSDVPGGTPPYEYTFVTDQCGNYGGEGECYNREHSFPKSWFNDASPMYTDLFHLYPTDGYVNGQRSNYPFGDVGSAYWTSQNGSKVGTCSDPGYSGTVFEPRDDFKGDFARTYFYMATRYENVIASWETYDSNGDAVLDGTSYPCFEQWAIDMLLAWHTADPVSAKETARNDAVHLIQGNRNPYIDHPEWVQAVWGTPEEDTAPPSFAGLKSITGNSAAATITLAWDAGSDASLPLTYLIFRSGTSMSYNFSSPYATTQNLFYSNSSLLPDTTYYYIVRARDASVNLNTDTNTKEFSLYLEEPPPDNEPPVFAGIKSITGDNALKEITVFWDSAADASAPVTYLVFRSTASMAYDFLSAFTETQALSYTDTVLTEGVTYYYIVRARDSSFAQNTDSNNVEFYFHIIQPATEFADANILLYPNPYTYAFDYLYLGTPVELDSAVLYSADGLKTAKLDLSIRDEVLKTYSVDLPKIKSGVYFLVLSSGKEARIFKLCVIR